MSIELHIDVTTPERRTSDPLPVKRVTFESRKAVFRVESSQHEWSDFEVNFYCGPTALWLQADEAEAMGKALIECAEHYRTTLANCKPEGG